MGGGEAPAPSSASPVLPSQRFNRYWEPFLGSAAVFFDLEAHGMLRTRGASRSPTAIPDLIACYRAVRDTTEQVVGELSRLARDRECSRQRALLRRCATTGSTLSGRALASAVNGGGFRYTPALAAMFIYLNRTGYNGLFRLNAGGEFNVPAGRYPNPRICDGTAGAASRSRALAQRGRSRIFPLRSAAGGRAGRRASCISTLRMLR